MTKVPCAARPGTEFYHPEGGCGCFVGGPAPQLPNPAEELNVSIERTREAFEKFSLAMRKSSNVQHGPTSGKRRGKDHLHVKLR